FNYQLDALSGKYNELNKAYTHVLGESNFMTPSVVLKLVFPFLRLLPEPDAEFRRGLATSNRIGMELYKRSKKATETTGTSQDRDLFSLLNKSNMSSEVPDARRMTEEEVLAREYASELFQRTYTYMISHQRFRHSWRPGMRRPGMVYSIFQAD
ncbi:hypothetical protein PQX77_002165, partial [Marasmius sp. AFHP31]